QLVRGAAGELGDELLARLRSRALVELDDRLNPLGGVGGRELGERGADGSCVGGLAGAEAEGRGAGGRYECRENADRSRECNRRRVPHTPADTKRVSHQGATSVLLLLLKGGANRGSR